MEFAQVKAATVKVTSVYTGEVLGTAFFISNHGHLMTCTHVIESGGGIDKIHFDSNCADLIAAFPIDGLDTSIVKVDENSQSVDLGLSFEPRDQFLTFGYGRDDFNGATVQGELTDTNIFLGVTKIRLLVAGGAQAIIGGYSGAPVYNEHTGKVVAIISEFDSENGGLAVPITTIAEQLHDGLISMEIVDEELVKISFDTQLSERSSSTHNLMDGHCPYCNTKNYFENPKITSEKTLNDLECLPYSRDIGRFDNGEWTTIGQDFYKSLNWDKKIGILRVEDSNYLIYYKVAVCSSCGYKFDVYANYTSCKKLYEIWTHLLSQPNTIELKEDLPKNAFFSVFEPMRQFLDNSFIFANLSILICLAILLVCTYFLQLSLQPLKPSYSLIEYLSIKIIGIFFLGLFLANVINHVEIFRKIEKFSNLFRIANKRGVFYWRNFTLARFLGYQKRGKVLITQYEVVASLPNVFSISCFWLAAKIRYGSISLLDLFELLFWGIVAYFMAANIWYSLNTSTYVMTTMLTIPNRIKSLEDMQLLEPFWKIVNQSATSIASICTFLIFLFVFSDSISLLGINVSEVQWIIWGFSCSVIICFLTLCTIRQLRRMCVITVMYILFLVGGYYLSNRNLIGNANFILVTGFFLSLLMISHYLWIKSYISKLVENCVDNIKLELRQDIHKIEEEINKSNAKLGNSRKADTVEFQKINSLTNRLRERKETFEKSSRINLINIVPNNINIFLWVLPSFVTLILYVSFITYKVNM